MLSQIFYISSTGLTAYHYDGRTLTRIDGFVAADAGLADFDPYLQHFGHLPTYVLADMVEEDFRIDSVAHTLGQDRKALLERHAARVYRGTEYRHSQILGRDAHNKRKDEVLFSSLLNSESVDLWLDTMLYYKVPIVGIASLPLLSSELMKKIWTSRNSVLFISHTASSGLRQSYFKDGQLRFSRLTPVVDLSLDKGYAQFVHSEIGKTKRYLSNLHLLARDVTLDVCMISGGDPLTQLEQMRDSETLEHYHLFSLHDVAKRLRYKGPRIDHECDELYAFMVARTRTPNHYASSERRFHYSMFRARQALSGLAVAASVSGLLWAGTQIVDGYMYNQDIAKTNLLLSQADARYGEIQAQLPITDIEPDDMRLAVAAAEQLQQQHTPHAVLSNLGQALQAHPTLHIKQIEWFVSSNRNAIISTLANDEVQEAAESAYDAEGNPIDGGASGELYQIGIVQGQVEPFDGDYTRAHHNIEALLAKLRATKDVILAEPLELPLNTATSGRVQGGIGGDAASALAPFTLRLVIGDDKHV